MDLDVILKLFSKKTKRQLSKIILILLFLLFIGIIFCSLLFINSINLNLKNNESLDLLSNEKDKISSLEANLISKQNEINTLQKEYLGAYKVPYVVMSGRNAEAVFTKLDGTLVNWTWSADAFEESFKKGVRKRELIPNTFVPLLSSNCETSNKNVYSTYVAYNDLCNVYCSAFNNCSCRVEVSNYYNNYVKMVNDCSGEIETISSQGLNYKNLDLGEGKTVSVIDFSDFVEDDLFDNVIDTIYDSSKSDIENINEIYNINSQLLTYSSEITETPRFSLETLSEGGGDCEDKAIFVASMLKSIPKDWKVNLVYMDSENPNNPKQVNHVVVQVDTGNIQTFIETTATKNGVGFYDNVVGWYFEV